MAEALERILADPSMRDILQVVKGGINGAIYGAKIRFPHALVMTLLFARHLSWQEKGRRVFRATRLHSQNLARFVFLFKLLLLVLRRLQGGNQHHTHYFLSGLLAGGYVFGDTNEVNMQINLYLLSRVTQGLARLSLEKAGVETPSYAFRLFGALVRNGAACDALLASSPSPLPHARSGPSSCGSSTRTRRCCRAPCRRR